MRETQGTDLTGRRMSSRSTRTMSPLIANLQDTRINMSVHVQLSSSRAVQKTDSMLSTSWDSTQNLAGFSGLFSARQELRHVQLRKSWIQPHAARAPLRGQVQLPKNWMPQPQHDKR